MDFEITNRLLQFTKISLLGFIIIFQMKTAAVYIPLTVLTDPLHNRCGSYLFCSVGRCQATEVTDRVAH